MASLRKHEKGLRQRAELPTMVKQISHSLESLAELTYHQLPFARADNESIEDYKARITGYFDKLFAIEKDLMSQLSDDDQNELAEAFAQVDIQCRESLLEMENSKFEPTQEELLAHYEVEEKKFSDFAEGLNMGERA